jgi:Ca2+-binding RTX toxin-like protein
VGVTSVTIYLDQNNNGTLDAGENAANLWNVVSANAGNVSGPSSMAVFSGFENLAGNADTDAFAFADGALVSGTISGGAGADTFDHSAYTSAITVNLQTGAATGTGGGFAGIERLVGGSTAGDTLVGRNVANAWHIVAPDAGDIGGPAALSFDGFENLTGGTSTDAFVFGNGATVTGTVNGGAGTDVLDYSAYTVSVAANLTVGLATGTGAVVGVENLFGGSAGDILVGNGSANRLTRGGGDDILLGHGGADLLLGDDGRDILVGGAGADSLTGRAGEDILIAGTTAHDAALINLINIRTRWISAAGYAARIADLKTTAPTLLPASTVFNDPEVDVLTGGADLDWFLFGSGVDNVTDPTGGEILDAF